MAAAANASAPSSSDPLGGSHDTSAPSTPHGPSPMAVDEPAVSLPEPPRALAVGTSLPRGAIGLRWLNRYLMIPATRAGLGAWLSSPFGGAMVLLRVRGRRSGQVRETPLNYLIADGAVWLLAGLGPRAEWYRNLRADARVSLVLPGRTIRGTAVEVRAPGVRARVIPALLRTTPLPSLAAGLDVVHADDAALTDALAWVPLIRVDPDGGSIEPGPDDPGGRGWVWRQALLLGASVLGVMALARAAGTVRRVSLRTDTGAPRACRCADAASRSQSGS